MKHVLLSLTLVSLLAMATGCRPIFTDQRPREMVYSGPAEQQPAAMQQAQCRAKCRSRARFTATPARPGATGA